MTVIQHLTVVNQLTSEQILPREKFHVDAFKAYASGDLPGACVHWEASIVEYPRGQYVCALVYCQLCCSALSKHIQLDYSMYMLS